jgi:class 3 adenylate cyclase
MLPRSNRTLICSVVFLDIVDYSKKPVTEQIRLKEWLNRVLGEALKDVAANDRIILDTGDGAAISFLGDPEDALFVCLTVRDAAKRADAAGLVSLPIRTGINLGPVKLIKDLNEQPNIIGDGINVAQRVMSFAAPNEVLVSRSYYEVVSCLSDAYAKLFQYQGSRTDKHVREHEVYAVGESTQGLKHVLDPARVSSHGQHNLSATTTVIGRLTHTALTVNQNLRRRPRLGTAVAVMAILAVAIGLRGLRGQPEIKPEKPIATVTAPAPVTPAGDKLPTPSASSAPPKKVDTPPVKAAKAGGDSKPKRAAEGGTAKPGVESTPKPAAAAGTGIVALTITPWGEIHVDGKHVGDVPPMHQLRLSAGRHRIEIRNPDYPPFVQTVEVKAGEQTTIRHWFQNEKIPLPWK